jgi:hypothetical protein
MLVKSSSEISIPIEVRAASTTSATFSSFPKISRHSTVANIIDKEFTLQFSLHVFVQLLTIHDGNCATDVPKMF